MPHFSDEAWADFVRGTTAPETGRQIEAHLADGCAECVAACLTWKQLRSVAISEPSFTPPDNAVRMVKQEFASRRVAQSSSWIQALLVFDSLGKPLPVGVRSGASESRQLVYEAEGTTVDLRLDAQPQSNTISLIGQVVDKKSTRITPRQVSVVLWAENGVPLVQTPANEFGEFQMEFAAQERLRLSIEIEGQGSIRIPPAKLNPKVNRGITKETKGDY
jgi:hypothetical protein